MASIYCWMAQHLQRCDPSQQMIGFSR